MIKVIGNALVAILAISVVAFICWIAALFTSVWTYFAVKVWFDTSMSVATQENIIYATFAACLIIALAMFLKSTWQGHRN